MLHNRWVTAPSNWRYKCVFVEGAIISAVIRCLSNFGPFSASPHALVMQYHQFSHTRKVLLLALRHAHRTLNLYLDISFSSQLRCAFVFWQRTGTHTHKHTHTHTASHSLMHMLNFRHTGGSLHNVWVWGCPARGDGGEADVLSALLHSPVLSWWGESPAWEEEGGSGRMEKLRRGGSSGELPIDMQRTVGEINPRHYLLHLHSADC